MDSANICTNPEEPVPRVSNHTCICGQEYVDDKCPKCYSSKPDQNLFAFLQDKITPSLELDIQIKHVAQNIFEFIDKQCITRGRPRQGRILACIYYAALHLGYALTVSELFMKSDVEQPHITSGIKHVIKTLQSCFINEYDVSITFEKHIRKLLLNVTHRPSVAELSADESDKILHRASWMMNRLNANDYFIDLAANTRAACVLWICLPPSYIPAKQFCMACNLSVTTFNKKLTLMQNALQTTGILTASNYI